MPVQLQMFDVEVKEPVLPKNAVIYRSEGRAGEYAEYSCNVYNGCDHGCVYCYVPTIYKIDRAEFVQSKTRGNLLRRLKANAQKYAQFGIRKQVTLSFLCDPYQHLDETEQVTRQAINVLHFYGQSVCILTKGGSRALRDIDLFSQDDAFATTLTCLDETESLKREPNAALPDDRISTIKAFHDAGIPTWVSLEPVLDPQTSLEIIRRTHPFVDVFKVGKLNYYSIGIDWRKFAQDAIALLESLGKDFYIKRDLIKYIKKGR